MDEFNEDGRDLHASQAAWDRFGATLTKWMARHDISIAQLHRRSGLDRKTLSRLREGGATSYFKSTPRKLEDALGWRRGAVEAVLEADDLDVDDEAAVDRLVLPELADAEARARAQGQVRVRHGDEFDAWVEVASDDELVDRLNRISQEMVERRRAAEREND